MSDLSTIDLVKLARTIQLLMALGVSREAAEAEAVETFYQSNSGETE